MLTILGVVAATPLAQGGTEQEGYHLQSPVNIPSEVFSVPTVHPAPTPEVERLYSTPQRRQQEQQPEAAEQPAVLQRGPDPTLRGDGPPAPPPTMEGMPYEFEWSINDIESGLVYSHQESSDGTVAQGEYRVLLPDGRLQIVTFEDRGQGYQAHVTYQDYNP